MSYLGHKSAHFTKPGNASQTLGSPAVPEPAKQQKSSLPDYRYQHHHRDLERASRTQRADSNEEERTSFARWRWLALVWVITFWIPSIALRRIGGIKRGDARIAWREKFASMVMIASLNAAIIFTMVYVGDYALFAFSIIFSAVNLVKSFCAFIPAPKTKGSSPESFVLCLIPVYNETKEEIRRSIDSVAQTRYEDRRKLLCIVCDGVAEGKGKGVETSVLVRDILGIDPRHNPDRLSFQSIDVGMGQHNMGRAFSGLYEIPGHLVPFLYVEKVGKPSEEMRFPKPGQRGKRDSQVLLLSFLYHIYDNMPMCPLELEMYHQIRNIIGVIPSFYEFLFMVDADVVVDKWSIHHFVTAFKLDRKIMGICGEMLLSNSNSSFWSWIQVYEYHKAFHETKAFESFFGSVTCLPGCFSMYRIHSAEGTKSLVASRDIIAQYSRVDAVTLHMKNQMTLGEDRYLTMVMLKLRANYSTKFLSTAKAWTMASETRQGFFSQRRRWINSTIHNMLELILMHNLCGFCYFSMRSVVFVDLLSTLMLPATGTSLVYLLYNGIAYPSLRTRISMILVAAPYGLQALGFLAKCQPFYILWMLVYLLAFPLWTVLLPVYSFWKQDDFTWGGTRMSSGQGGKKKVTTFDEGRFDPDHIPRKKWDEYQLELWGDGQHDEDKDCLPHVDGFHLSAGVGSDMETQGLDRPMPSDDQLLADVRDILQTKDLMTVTKKTVQLELQQKYGSHMAKKRVFINSAVDALFREIYNDKT